MPVGDYCHAAPYTVGLELSAREAVQLMDEKNVGSLIAVNDGRPLGIVTDRDVALRVLCDALDPDVVRVAEIMEHPVVSIRSDAPLWKAVSTMRARRLRRLVVVDTRDRLVGILTADDVLALLATELTDAARAALAHPPRDRPALSEIQTEAEISRSE